MIQTIQGVYRDGKVELFEQPQQVGETRVLVTFLPALGPVDGPALTPEEIAELCGKLEAWQDDWSAPGMEAYDDYEARRRGAGPLSSQ